jgi:hypothetical protein
VSSGTFCARLGNNVASVGRRVLVAADHTITSSELVIRYLEMADQLADHLLSAFVPHRQRIGLNGPARMGA